MASVATTPDQDRPGLRTRVMALLLLAYIFNFIDRQIIGILAIPIKTDLGLTDGQLGLMGGLAFALFYTGLGIPIAVLADRANRARIIAVAVTIWSAFTVLCGFANSFLQLFLARMGVGVGEAGGVAPSYSLISDYFPPERRARALAVFSFGIPIGSALGVFLGGWLASAVDWRTAFIVVGVAGVLVGPAIWWGVPEPARGRYDKGGAAAHKTAPFGAVLARVTSRPSFWFLAFGAACSSIMGYGLAFWVPSVFARSFGMSLGQISLYYGTIVLLGGLLGVWMGGAISDRLGRRSPAFYAVVPGVAFLLAVPLYAGGLFVTDLWLGFPLFLLPTALALAWLGPVVAAIQHIVPPPMRATASAMFLFINNLIGIGFGTWFLGGFADSLKPTYGDDALRWAIFYCLSFYLLAAVFMALAAWRLPRDWWREPEAGQSVVTG